MPAPDSILAWAMPLAYLTAALFVPLERPLRLVWGLAETAAAAALGAALAAAAFAGWMAAAGEGATDALGMTMALLVGLLGWVIVRYSRRYLNGEPGQPPYLGALLLTLAAVSVVALTDHLGLLLLAWIASSLGLHRLLTFYPERPAALMAAHKKFIASRAAELCMALALVLIWNQAGTLSMTGITAYIETLDHMSWALHGAALLVAAAAVLKSAQLPVHGWLIQVMEAPTPVSALLHAGIVNLGGFVLIRLTALLSASTAAQSFLVVVGSLTAVLAALVMMTRISIKVRLAWSTCAQMGFMLMECGLGLYDLAFLHLVAHSLYKAHAFLTAGEAVLDARRAALLPRAADRGLAARLAAAPFALLLVFAAIAAWQALLPTLVVPPAALLILGFGLAPLLWRTERSPSLGLLRGLVAVLVISQLYLFWHMAFRALVGVPSALPSPLQTLWVAACFGGLYTAQIWFLAYPAGRLSRAVYPWAYAGFHLDERFTRLTLRLWPMRQPAPTRVSGEQT